MVFFFARRKNEKRDRPGLLNWRSHYGLASLRSYPTTRQKKDASELSAYPKPTHPREVIEAAYARSNLFERQRALMDDWAGYLDGPS